MEKYAPEKFVIQQLANPGTNAMSGLTQAISNLGNRGVDREKQKLELSMLELKKQNIINAGIHDTARMDLANKKFEFEKKKYKDKENEILQSKKDILSGLTSRVGSGINSPLREDVTTDKEKDIMMVNASAAQKIADTFDKDDKYKRKTVGTLSQREKDLFNGYKDLDKIKDPIDKRLAQIKFAKDNNLYDADEADGPLDFLGKNIAHGLTNVEETVFHLGINPVRKMFSKEEDALLIDKKRLKDEAFADEYWKEDKPDTLLQEQLSRIRAKKDAIKDTNEYNKGVDKRQNDFVKSLETKQRIKYKDTKKNVLKSESRYTNEITTQTNSALNKIKNSNMTIDAQTEAAKRVLLAEKEQISKFRTAKDSELKSQAEIRKAQIKVESDKEIARYEAELEAAAKAAESNPEIKRLELAQKAAAVRLENAKAIAQEIENE